MFNLVYLTKQGVSLSSVRQSSLSMSGPGQSSGGWGGMPPSPGAPDANMMMQQIQQLQKTVMQLQTSGSGSGARGGAGAGGRIGPSTAS